MTNMKVSRHAIYLTNKGKWIETYEFRFCDIFVHLFMSVNLFTRHVAMVEECRVKNSEVYRTPPGAVERPL